MPTKDGTDGEPGAPSSGPREEDEMSQNKENKGFRATLEQWQSTIDERIRAVLPNFQAFRELEQEVRRLHDRLDSLEKKLEKGPGGTE
jgi:predicted  nucleic acid-binding Zn-ribbon protein